MHASDGHTARARANLTGRDLAIRVEMHLVADRFLQLPHNKTIDLATGEAVTLIESSAGGRMAQTRWGERCDWLYRVRHRAVARLVDYGVCGEGRRFEVWRCARCSSQSGPAAEVVERAGRFFRLALRTPGAMTHQNVGGDGGSVVVIPDAECGYEAPPDQTIEPTRLEPTIDDYGHAIVNRRAVTAVAEVFAEVTRAQPRVLALSGPAGGGIRTAVRDLARAARCQGFVPIRLSAAGARLSPGVLRAVRGRSLCVLAVNQNELTGWRALIDCLMECGKPHVLIFVGAADVGGVHGVALGDVTADVLAASLIPAPADPAVRARVQRAAIQAKGSPARFVQLLWRSEESPPVRWGNRAAEQAAVYGGERDDADARTPASTKWPVTSEVVGLRARMDEAVAAIARGRHEPGTRALRQLIGSLGRRADWGVVVSGQLALGKALLRRGRARDAQAVLNDAQQTLVASDDQGAHWLDVAVLSGVAWTDLGRLDEAETVLHGAMGAARAARDRGGSAAIRLALARCLFWRGRFNEAAEALAPMDTAERAEDGQPAGTSARARIAAARVAVGRADLAGAISRATRALEIAEQSGDPSLVADAAYAAAFAHRAVGDARATTRDLALCLAAAKAAHDPLRRIRARLLEAEHALDAGPSRRARALMQRLARIGSANLPATIRARRDVLLGLFPVMPTDAPVADAVKRQIAATGLQALALFAPSHGRQPECRPGAPLAMPEFLDILQCCQRAEEGRAILVAVLARLRTQLGAAAVGCVSATGQVIGLEGGRIEPRIADRVLAAGQTIGPHAVEGSLESGAPVRYGADSIAALVCRWSPGTSQDAARAAAVLTLAATAIAPAVAEAVARGRETAGRALGDILGTTDAIAGVCRAIEQAGAAPFPVLIEGESGSGKELVARAIHRHGVRRDRAFCSINCAALPDDLIESELFGHARGAFTGAVGERAGMFEEAHTGTLFLDEVGELSPRAQAKLLRTIQEGEVRRVGENVTRRVDVRIVAATNRELGKESAAGRFRPDLLYRLDVIRIAVPALRDRRDDIPILAERFWQDATARLGSRAILSPPTIAALTRYDWPGNVRELQNVLASLAVRSPKRGLVPPTALPPPFQSGPDQGGYGLNDARRSFEERFVRAALTRTAGHRQQAARELGVTRQGLAKLMTRLGIAD